jgi:predicted GIY-YIG superfamily endonuclease
MYFVYALVDPRTSIVAYVGITNNPNARLKDHISGDGPNDEKKAWIQKLQEEGYEPCMEVLEIVDTKKKASEREKYWIQHYISLGMPVTNIVYRNRQTIFQSQAPDGYYTAAEAAERLNTGNLSLPQSKTFRDIFPERRRVKKMLDTTYSVLMNHVRAGRIRSITPSGKHQAVYLKEDVDLLSQPEKNYYTAKEAQEILGMTYSALKHQVNMGNVHSFILPEKRQPVYLKEDVDHLSREIKAFWGRKDTTTS